MTNRYLLNPASLIVAIVLMSLGGGGLHLSVRNGGAVNERGRS